MIKVPCLLMIPLLGSVFPMVPSLQGPLEQPPCLVSPIYIPGLGLRVGFVVLEFEICVLGFRSLRLRVRRISGLR